MVRSLHVGRGPVPRRAAETGHSDMVGVAAGTPERSSGQRGNDVLETAAVESPPKASIRALENVNGTHDAGIAAEPAVQRRQIRRYH
ncbi:hypothetical protein [Haloferax sp. DFSO52]|uniref:hypothetical protein n=1 Tax=Haloferax sp. DFSO52 TaxID=3388505 RepID=UPI003A84272E